MADETAIHSTIEQYWARFSANDREGWLDLFADGATVEDPVGSPVHTGRDEIGAFWDQTRTTVDSIELRGIFRAVLGNEAAFHMEVRPTLGGQQFTMSAIDHMIFDDEGRIVSMRAFFDASTMAPLGD